MILLFIFLIGCLVMSLVAVGLLFALSAVGYGDDYLTVSSARSRVTQEATRGAQQQETVHSESHS